MDSGIIFDIQRFSVNDGPGIRTTVFLKGCPLACRWCHNPEGRNGQIQMRFFQKKCIGCGRCVTVTNLSPHKLAGKTAGATERKAAEICPTGALCVCGKEYTKQELLEIIKRDLDFYGTNGGVTFSGGEPMAQAEFLEKMLRLCQEEKIHTTLDTCGYASRELYERLLPLCDLVLFDIKAINPEKHRCFTGKDNDVILENFRLIAESDTPIWVRIPLISGCSAEKEELKNIAESLKPYQQRIQQVTLIPYHSFGNTKYQTLGLDPDEFDEIDDEMVQEYEQVFEKHGFTVGR